MRGGNDRRQPHDTQAMSATQDAALIQAAVDRLRVDHPAPAILKAATTALTHPAQNRAWLTQVAEHVASRRPCCRYGAAACEFARHAMTMARRILDADTSDLEIVWRP